MDDKYRKLSAYERRKINSQKIAQFEFEPKHPLPEGAEKHYSYIKKKYDQFTKESDKVWKEPKWSPNDQTNEEELWDE